jgi:hypothetical protein
MLTQSVRMEPLDCLENAGVERAAPFLEKARVDYLLSQCVLEGVLELGEEPRFVEELKRRCISSTSSEEPR